MRWQGFSWTSRDNLAPARLRADPNAKTGGSARNGRFCVWGGGRGMAGGGPQAAKLEILNQTA